MALNYNVTKCDPAAQADPAACEITSALALSTMAVGLGTLSEKNLPEWRARLAFLKAFDPAGWAPLADLPRDAWAKRFGLYTNVVNETRAGWLRRMSLYEMAEIERRHRAAEKEAAAKLTNDCL